MGHLGGLYSGTAQIDTPDGCAPHFVCPKVVVLFRTKLPKQNGVPALNTIGFLILSQRLVTRTPHPFQPIGAGTALRYDYLDPGSA